MRILALSLIGSLALSLIPGAIGGEGDIRVDVSKFGSPEKIYVYNKGSIALDRTVSPDSDDARAIAAWLASHKDGWRYSFRTSITSYAPQRYIRGERFSLNFTSSRFCVLCYEEGEGKRRRYRQLTREITKDDPIPKVFHAVP